jgi:hypothetical protein
MIKLENVEVVGLEPAIRGMRNPMNSWEKSDSEWVGSVDGVSELYSVGPNDHKLMTSLAKGGPVHAKYRRMINVYVDITAPFYWWKEFDTYKVGTVANSCSTMHKIHAKEFELSDFSTEHLLYDHDDEICPVEAGLYYEAAPRYSVFFSPLKLLETTIKLLNSNREAFLKTKDKKYWWQMIQLLPTSYNQKRTVMLNYEVLNNIYHSRKNHKLDEWHVFCDWIKGLPYSELITGEKEEE